MSKNYVIATAWDRSYIKDRLYYCMDAQALTELEKEQKLEFGDKVYIIKDKLMYIRGNDNQWYEF